MTLEDMALWSEILGSLTVFGAVIFGLIQIRQFRTQRRDLAAIELVRSFQDELFSHGYTTIADLPSGMTGKEFKALGGDFEELAMVIGLKYETVGLLVFRGIVPLDIVQDLVGGIAVILWEQLKPWVDTLREERDHPSLLEWYEWLVLQLEAHRSASDMPAHERHRDWTPAR